MTWFSLVGLLAFTSSALGRSAYGNGYSAAPIVAQAPRIMTAIFDQSIQRPLLPVIPTQAYGQQQPLLTQRIAPIMQQDTSYSQAKVAGGYGSPLANPMVFVRTAPVSGYGVPSVPQFDQTVFPPPPPPPTQADILCQGQAAETVIPLGDGSRFVVCLDNGKGVEQDCPQGLIYNTGLRRCERRSGPVDPCAAQPCLNGGQCVPTESTYQCQCPPGFDGQICELDARVCQTQQPCGQAPDSRCQSFRLGAALQYICIFQGGFAYGLSAQQVIPSPCSTVDGPFALTVSNGGFIMCDADRMFVESCPGGTLWDDVEKACSWPDQQTFVSGEDQTRILAKSTYGNQYNVPQQIERPRMIQPKQVEYSQPAVSYGAQLDIPKPRVLFGAQLDLPKQVSSYGGQFDIPKPRVSSYGAQLDLPKQVSSYGAQLDIPKQVVSYGAQLDLPKQVSSYGAQLDLPKQVSSYSTQLDIPKQVSSYGAQLDIPKQVSSYGAQLDLPKQVSSYGAQLDIPKQVVSYGAQLDRPKQVSSYGAQLDIPRQVSSYGAQLDLPKQVSSYGAQLDLPKQVSSYGAQLDIPRQVSSYGAQLDIPKPKASYGAQLDISRPVPSFGAQILLPQQPERVKVIHQQRDEFVPTFTPSEY